MNAKDKVKILLADDRTGNREALCAILEPLGEELLATASGEEALRVLLEHEVAVILLDVNMPRLGGFETAALVRRRERTQHVPIIFLTADDPNLQSARKGYELGAVDVIFRPLEAGDILRFKVSVFVDLYRARKREVDLQAELQHVRELEQELAFYRSLSGATLPVGERLYAAGEMGASHPKAFDELKRQYGVLLENYLENQVLNVKHDVKSGLRELAEALCLYRAHPREVVRLHMEVLREKSKVAPPPRSNALIAEGRLLVLELMGDVAALYRRYAYGPAPRPRPEKE